MSKQQKGLGRGLGALLGDLPEEAVSSSPSNLLPLHKIEPNPKQPRKVFDEEALEDLAESIREHGLIQPIAVRPEENGYYRIIAGERRWRAARMAGLTEVPVLILNADDKAVMELAMIENLQRKDLNPIEEARGYQSLMDEYGLTQEEAAERVGKSRPAVANALRLLLLPKELQDMLVSEELSAGHARALLALPKKSQQLQAAQKVVCLHLSVRQTESLCKSMQKEEKAPKKAAFQVDYIGECEKELSSKYGRKVSIIPGKRKGHLDIEYYGNDDLQVLLDLLSGKK